MDPAELTATQLEDRILRFCTLTREHIENHGWAVVREACHRLKQHEGLLRDVLPDLRARLTAAEGGRSRLPFDSGPTVG